MANTGNKNTWLESMFAGMTGLFTGFSQYLTGEAGFEDALSRASTSTFNARQSRLDTAAAVKRTEAERRDFVGAGNVGRAKQGVAAGGSASLVIDEADRSFAMDVLAMKYREELTQIESQSQAAATLATGKAKRKIGRIGAFGSLLKAGTNFAEARNLRIGNG